jgi:anti-anti-sigma regulatory factor
MAYDTGAALALVPSKCKGVQIDMLRITENTDNGKTVRLRLDGTVTSASYDELATVCSRHQASAEKIILLDMTGVVFMNNEVAGKVAGLQNEQLRIINCSPFIETLLNTVERDLKNQQ